MPSIPKLIALTCLFSAPFSSHAIPLSITGSEGFSAFLWFDAKAAPTIEYSNSHGFRTLRFESADGYVSAFGDRHSISSVVFTDQPFAFDALTIVADLSSAQRLIIYFEVDSASSEPLDVADFSRIYDGGSWAVREDDTVIRQGDVFTVTVPTPSTLFLFAGALALVPLTSPTLGWRRKS